MFEKVNPSHPDKVADRIAGGLVDIAYGLKEFPKVAVEVLIGHGLCDVRVEGDVLFDEREVLSLVRRVSCDSGIGLLFRQVPQDVELSRNQEGSIRCGDNGIFRGVPVTVEQERLSDVVRSMYEIWPTDGKMLYDMSSGRMVICQSCAESAEIRKFIKERYWDLFGLRELIVNPLGEWTGGIDVDCGATNRKLGSDMGSALTGGGTIGKDLSKADVSVNIYLHILSQMSGKVEEACCAIGDEVVNGIPYAEMVNIAKFYIDECGGFEKYAEWGLV